jgi:hypothetical protein
MKARPEGSTKSRPGLPTEHASDDDLAAYCPDLDQWPRSWRYEERDVFPGQKMVDCFKPFLRHLLSSDLSRKTLRKHRDNLWALGGEIIAELHKTPRLRKRPMQAVVVAALDEEGGPLLSHHESEEEQRSFDSTCRKLLRFLKDCRKKQRSPKATAKRQP